MASDQSTPFQFAGGPDAGAGQYRALFEHLPVGVYRSTPAGEVLDANPALVEMLGYPDRDTLLTRRADDLYADPEERLRWRRAMERDGTVRGFETRYRRSDGSTLWIRESGRAVADPRGQVVYFEGVVEDVTPARRHEEERQRLVAREREARAEAEAAHQDARSVLESITDALLLLDRELRVTYLNPAARDMARAVTPMGPDGIVGRPLLELFPEAEGHEFTPYFRRALEEKVPVHYETFYPPFALWLDVHLYPSRGGLAVYLRDITARKRRETEVAAAHARLRHILAASPTVIYTLDASYRVTWVSENFEKKLGHTLEEAFSGDWWRSRVHPHDLPRVLAEGSRLFEDDAVTKEYRFRRPDGSYFWVRDEERLVRDDAGAPVEIVGTWTDVTDRVAVEDALRESEERHRQLVENIREVFWLVELDPGAPHGSRVVYASPAYEEITGRSCESLAGDSLSGMADVHAEDIQTMLAAFRGALGGEPTSAEYRILHADGEVRWIFSRYSAVRGVDGAVYRIAGISEDVTERKRAEQELRDREKQLAEAQEIAHVGSWEWEVSTGATTWSDEMWRICGYEPGAFTPSYDRFLEAVHPDDRERIRGTVEAACLTGEAFSAGLRLVRPDGTIRIVETRGEVVRDELGRPVRLIGTGQDVTRWRQLEEQFRQSQKMEAVGRLAGGIAHDFNNLLMAIRGNAELLLLDLPEPDPVQEGLLEIKEASDRAAALTRQLLAFSRKQMLQPEVVSLNTLVRRIRGMIGRLVREDVEVCTDLDPDLGQVRADPGQVDQVLMNLVVNARDAMPDGGRITIRTVNRDLSPEEAERHPDPPAAGRYVVLSVSDMGVGMDAATQARIWEPFFTTKEPGKGTGLGLATAHGIIHQSGGFATVRSRPGEGATFEVFLPRVDDAETGAGSREETDAPAATGETVLVVEDEPSVRLLVRRILQRNGFAVLEAADGDGALHQLESHRGPIHLVLTDVIMPGMSGSASVARLRRVLPGLRVLYMSGYTDDAIAHHGVLDPGVALLEKPFTPEALVSRVRQVLDGPSPAA